MRKNGFNLNKKTKSPPKNSNLSPESPLPGEAHASRSSSSSTALRIQDSDDLRQVFNKYDRNGDGKISLSELRAMLRSLGNEGSPEEVESMMKVADLDGDGYISLEEFISVNRVDTNSAQCMEDLRTAFTAFDLDQNGLISADELHHVLRSMGEKMSLADCKSMIKGVDQNGDGVVNFEEFIQMMTRSKN